MIRLEAVGKDFGKRTVLRNLTFSVHAGSIVLVVGPNGAGKSTLLHVMAGLCRPDAGAVVSQVPDGGIGYLGHAALTYPELTALENLAFWCALHGMRVSETAMLDALALMELVPFADERAGTFSRGMAQRLSLARMLLLEPTLALLDEPLAGLDSVHAARMREEFALLKARGVAVVWVTHDLANDAPFADAVLVLERNGSYALHDATTFRTRLHCEKKNTGGAA